MYCLSNVLVCPVAAVPDLVAIVFGIWLCFDMEKMKAPFKEFACTAAG